MKRVLGSLIVLLAFSAVGMEIYKCPGGIYTNSDAEATAKACKRLAKRTDPVSSTDAQEVVIRKNADGHFWMKGLVNGRPVNFIVDTGATFVTVSEEIASAANLSAGQRVVMSTANGSRVGRVVDGVSVSASIFTVPHVKVSVGLSGLRPDEALLGQSFLSQFEITMDEHQLVLRNKKN